MNLIRLSAALLILSSLAASQQVPDLIYYRFNEGFGTQTVNAAVPGVGAAFGTLTGTAGFMLGQFGTTGLSGTGQPSANDHVDTGWTMNLTGTSWTVEFWYSPGALGTGLQYLTGVPVGGAFRIYTGGTLGGAIFLTGSGLTSVTLTGATPAIGTWVHIAFVFNNSTVPPTATGYVNGVAGPSVSQTGALTLNQGVLFVGGQVGNGLNGRLDEYRFWGSARTATEIAQTFNVQLNSFNTLAASTTGGGVGNLNLSLTNVSPTAAQGYTLVTLDTSGPIYSGPILGIRPDAVTWSILGFPSFPGNPLHFPTGFPGFYPDAPFILPNGGLVLPIGTTWDLVALFLNSAGSYDSHSNVVRIVF